MDAVFGRELTQRAGRAENRLPVLFVSRDPARITRYCIDVASAYHRFYNACRIMGTEGAVQQGRIALCLAVRGVIRNILTMFKVSVPETM